jgi:catechol 2,3-dioxygenase-like lactoylglutathione lyase family enzyme
MLHHVSVGVADVPRAAKFYDAVLGALGYKRVMEFMPYAIAYGEDTPSFWVQLPNDKNSASVGNGAHIGFIARSKQAVEDFHATALANGGKDNGAPGPRPDYGPEYFGAFVLDLDGNKLEATLMQTAPDGVKDPEEKRKAKEARKAAKAATAGAVTDKKAAKKKAKEKAERKASKKGKGEKDKSGKKKKKRTPEEKAERRKLKEAKKT